MIRQALAEICKELFAIEVAVVLTRPDPQFGDYATNVALQLAQKVGQNPREIAEAIAVKTRENLVKTITEVTVAGPGFINIRVRDEVLLAELATVLQPVPSSKRTVLVEYSDPNPLKPLHAGHLYTTLVGDAIARLIERSGAQTIRLNYGGDVGLHVGKSLWAIVQELGGEYPEKLASIAEEDRSTWLGERYVAGNAAYDDDETARAEIIATNKKVYQIHATQDHDSTFAHIYWTVRQWSYDYFALLYQQLGVVPFDRFIPESEVISRGIETVRAHTGTVYQESDGAVIFNGEAHGLHTRVFMNSEGLPTYEAKEVGLLETKWQDYQFNESIVITANEQDQYMQVVLKSIEQFQPEPVRRTKHLTHGVVKLAGGVKMSSRKGNIVSALDILTAARAAGTRSGRAHDERSILAAVKYAFLKNRIGADVIYDPEESVALEGNSGPYLQYAHARARSILAKAPAQSAPLATIDSGERTLVQKLTEYPEAVARATVDLMPHHVCTYLYELAQVFNRFYEQNHVIGSERQTERIALVGIYAAVLRDGLDLLGIHAPERM